MPKKVTLLLFYILFLVGGLRADDAMGIKFSGFVKTDLMLDSRQTIAAREGHFLLYPKSKNEDSKGNDINAGLNMNILAIQTRLKGTITGPDAFGAKTGGIIEAAFFGHSNSDVNGFRLRHAFFTLTWDRTSLLIGQFWHPMFVTDVFPGTVSFNTGAPFQPFSRNPQIRLTRTTGHLKLIAAAMSQRDFTSTGPDGSGSAYLRNAGIPNLHLQLQLKAGGNLFGVGSDWKILNPRLKTPAGYKNEEKVNSVSILGYARFNLPNLTWKVEGVMGNNLTDHLMLGGFGTKTIDETTEQETYVPTGVYSFWTDISTGKSVALGCFAGYTKNTGASDELLSCWGRGLNIDVIYRVAPRIMWNSGRTRIATELEYTAASYGTGDSKGVVENAEFVNNVRLLLAAYYFF